MNRTTTAARAARPTAIRAPWLLTAWILGTRGSPGSGCYPRRFLPPATFAGAFPLNRETQRRYAALDGLRGIAALAVFAIHVWIYQLPNTVELRRDSWEKTLLFEGRVAFVMFFVLSGYLLYRAFARAALRQGEPVNVRSYLVRRAARIVPAYYVAILGTVALVSLAGDVPGRRLVDAAQLPLFFVFGQNYSPDTLLKLNAATWTLAVEVAFYLMLPVIGWLALRWSRGQRRPPGAAARRARGGGPRHGTPSTTPPAGARSQLTRRRPSCRTSRAGCWSPCWSSRAARAAARRSAGAPARRSSRARPLSSC